MASPSFLSLLLFLTISLQQYSSSSSSTIYLPLAHKLSKTQTANTHHLLKTSSLQSTTRFKSQRHHQQISLPLSPGSDYILSLSLGQNPTRTINLYMDTGSDLVWFPCAPFECILCDGKPDIAPDSFPLNITSATFVPCNSPVCSAVHSSLSSSTTSDLCAIAGCPLETIETADCSAFRCPSFYYAYGDGSLIAHLRRDGLSIPTSQSKSSNSTTTPLLHLPNFTFGCANTALAEPVGVAGFGRGVLSLPAQLAAFSPPLGNRFSYCLISHSFSATRLRHPSPLILGRSSGDDLQGEFVYTPMLDNPKHPYFYSVGLEAVSVSGKRLPATPALKRIDREGNGGMVVDSGTTFTMLPAGIYGLVLKEFGLGMRRNYERATAVEEEIGMGLCYYYHELEERAKVPKLVLHFAGNASVVLPRSNYFFGFEREEGGGQKRKVGCLMLMSGGDESESGGGPAATLGNYQQQGFEVVYDLEERRVGFARRRCAELWDTLSRG